MGSPIVGNAGDECLPRTASDSKPVIRAGGFRKNLLLIITLFGVVFGVVEGEF